MTSYDVCETAFTDLLGSSSKKDRNEATTRLHLIDRILFECLGWDRSDCIAEEESGREYADYSLFDRHRVLIVEAKREGQYFEVPVTADDETRRSISYFKKHSKPTYEAIRQCIDYCTQRGTPFGAVCNGQQLVAFIASRSDGVSPLDGDAVVFQSLQSMADNFLLLWNCLSKDGIRGRHLLRELLTQSNNPPPEKLSHRIANYPGYKNRNDLQTELQILGDLIIEDILRASGDKREFLQECYCVGGALSQYSLISRTMLEARYSVLFEKATGGPTMKSAIGKRGVDPELLANSLSQRPILLVGDVGVGKTSFVSYLIQIEARETLSNAIVLYIDLGSKPAILRDLRTFIPDEISRQLHDEYSVDIEQRDFVRAAYHSELSRWEKGIYSAIKDSDPQEYTRRQVEFLQRKMQDTDNHIKTCLEHLVRSKRKQVVVFLDNIDQRPYDFQQETFLIGNSIAQNWPAVVFISIRPETYYKSRTIGTLSAYHPKAFTISPPRLDLVIQKRLKYALFILDKGGLRSLPGVGVHSGSLRNYVKILLDSFHHNKELIEFCDNMCGGNIRLALGFIKTFIGSGHVDTQKILSLYQEQGHYQVPLHEFCRAVIYGDHEYFEPGQSVIMNVFDISTPDTKEHFLVPIILAQLERLGQTSTDGFVRTEAIFDVMQKLGFLPAQINLAIANCLSKKIIEHPARSIDEKTATMSDIESDHLRITSPGAYYIRHLVRRFVYVDAMVEDTPIVHKSARDLITAVKSIDARLDRADTLRKYLDGCWEPLAHASVPFDWLSASHALSEEIALIRRKRAIRNIS